MGFFSRNKPSNPDDYLVKTWDSNGTQYNNPALNNALRNSASYKYDSYTAQKLRHYEIIERGPTTEQRIKFPALDEAWKEYLTIRKLTLGE